MESENVIIKCLGKTLKTEIKYVANVRMVCLNSSNRNVESVDSHQKRPKIVCLGIDKIFILNESMEKIFDKIPYELLSHIEVDRKSKENFSLFIKPNTLTINSDMIKINIYSEYRGDLMKNFMCYHSVYYMNKYSVIKTLPLLKEKIEEPKSEGNKVFTKLKQRTLKSYKFFLIGFINYEYNNSVFRIKYDNPIHAKNEEMEKKQEDTLTHEGELNIEISDPLPMGKLDLLKDDRDLSFFASRTFVHYLRNTLKVSKYWILKNRPFTKKLNLSGDICQWDGWMIEARISDPFYKNVLCIFLRRKFLPPYCDFYQNFQVTLLENCSREFFQINPLAYKLIELVAGSLYTRNNLLLKDSQLFLKAKIDSLLVDEETLYFYQIGNRIVGNDIHKFGFDFLYSLLHYFEHNSMKDKVEWFKHALVTKFKSYEFDEEIERWKFDKRTHEFLSKIEEYIDSKIEEMGQIEEKQHDFGINAQNDENTPKNFLQLSPGSNEETFENTPGKRTHTDQDKFVPNIVVQEYDKKQKIRKNWRLKVMRFLSYCLNGGLTDYSMTYEKFIQEIFNKTQSTNSDIQELIFQTINIVEIDNYDGKCESTKEKIFSLNENSKLIFNEEALAVCIKSGFLAKYFSENTTYFPKFLKIILSNYCSNKILNALLEYLKSINDSIDENVISPERKAFIDIIPPLLAIFTDKKKSPITLTICCKCICFLISKKCEEVFRKKVMFEGNIIYMITYYLNTYDYDEKLVLCCLDLFAFVFSEPELSINEHLYNNGLFDRLKNFFEPTGVPGTYYSQRIIIKVLTIFLNLTNRIEAGIKGRVNSPNFNYFFDLLLRLVDDEKKYEIIDPCEEESFILEFKTYWLMCILTFKNSVAKEYYKSHNIKEFIEKKSVKFIKLINSIISHKSKGGFSENKITAISKNISKFFEFVYYLVVNERSDIIDFKTTLKSFNILKNKVDDNKSLLLFTEKEGEVFNWVTKIYQMTEDEYN